MNLKSFYHWHVKYYIPWRNTWWNYSVDNSELTNFNIKINILKENERKPHTQTHTHKINTIFFQ